MFELPQRLRFDLANSLTRQRKLLADFLQCVLAVHAEAKAQAYDALLACRE